MRSKIARKVLEDMPIEKRQFNRKHANILVRIHQLMKAKGMTQKNLAEKLDKTPSEINKWLKGDHNFTLMSLCKLEAALGASILEIPKQLETPKQKVFKSVQGTSFTMTVHRTRRRIKVQPFKESLKESYTGEIKLKYG